MAHKNTETVARAWLKGERKAVGAISTDGQGVYSYNLRIGYRRSGGKMVVLDYQAIISMTTSQHVSGVRDALAKLGVEFEVKQPTPAQVAAAREGF